MGSDRAIRDETKATKYRHDHGVLNVLHPHLCRVKVESIFDEIPDNRELDNTFKIHITAPGPGGYAIHRSLRPVFGKLILAKYGESREIEEDMDGRYRETDLHNCPYVRCALRLRQHHRDLSISVRPLKSRKTHAALKTIYGDSLEICKLKFLNHQAVHLFEAMPDLRTPNPPIIVQKTKLHVRIAANTSSSFGRTRYQEKRNLQYIFIYACAFVSGEETERWAKCGDYENKLFHRP